MLIKKAIYGGYWVIFIGLSNILYASAQNDRMELTEGERGDACAKICEVMPEFDCDPRNASTEFLQKEKDKIELIHRLKLQYENDLSLYSYLIKQMAPLDRGPIYFTPVRRNNYYYKDQNGVYPFSPQERRQLQIKSSFDLLNRVHEYSYTYYNNSLDAALNSYQEAVLYGYSPLDVIDQQALARSLVYTVRMKFDIYCKNQDGCGDLMTKLVIALSHMGID